MTDDKTAEALHEMKAKIHEGAMYIVGNSKDITSLQEWQVRQNGALQEINLCLRKIERKINSLELEVVKGKPSWATVVIITFLSSVAVGAVIFALKTAQ